MKVGTDMVLLDRIARLYQRKGIPNRIFTQNERSHILSLGAIDRLIERMAGKFCGKEAVAKALGTGIGFGVKFSDIEIVGGPNNVPMVLLHGIAKEIFEQEYTEIQLSITHDGDYAMAVCVLN